MPVTNLNLFRNEYTQLLTNQELVFQADGMTAGTTISSLAFSNIISQQLVNPTTFQAFVDIAPVSGLFDLQVDSDVFTDVLNILAPTPPEVSMGSLVPITFVNATAATSSEWWRYHENIIDGSGFSRFQLLVDSALYGYSFVNNDPQVDMELDVHLNGNTVGDIVLTIHIDTGVEHFVIEMFDNPMNFVTGDSIHIRTDATAPTIPSDDGILTLFFGDPI